MRTRWQRGEGDMDGIIILAVLLVIVLIAPKSPEKKPDLENSAGARTSSASQAIRLGAGNAAYADLPYEEYITIENQERSAINMTGWQLRNGKDERPYYLGGTLQRLSADIAALPRLVLGPNERAIITTGSVNVQTPYPISNFRENMCTGYLEALPDYAFTPPLAQNCPRPSDEPGVENLPGECRDFISTLSSCRTPEFDAKDSKGEACETCINGRRLPNQCSDFIKERFNYGSCVARHSNDQGFNGRTWRIFLGRGWEMWAKDYETIELYDKNGQLVNFQNY